MAIYSGGNTISNWISSTWNGITNVVVDAGNYTVSWFQQIGEVFSAALLAVLQYPLIEIMGIIALIGHFLYIIGIFLNYLLAPFYYIINLGGGFLAAVGQNYDVASAAAVFQSTAIVNFILAFPGYSILVIVLNSMFWVLLGLHVMHEIKNV